MVTLQDVCPLYQSATIPKAGKVKRSENIAVAKYGLIKKEMKYGLAFLTTK